ncbi:ribonuclease J [Anaerosoma tenue]|uniref:ribonuclease J n=1 Tax=Anaerosoma tenue TaxID=2933588 RepID=UPI0022609C87|nr:ribonuclease J [Anaerosoma tenue]
MNRLRVIPLGGLDGIGKNMTVLELGNDMIVIDAGLMFPDDDHPGIDLILPDYSYIVQRKDKLRGIIITHGHEDHTGALPYLLKDLGAPVPVLGTKLTLGIIAGKLEEHRIKKPKLREIKPGGHVNLGMFGLDFFAVNHSIPDGVAVYVRTPAGTVLHTGDFKLDQTPIDGRFTDFAGFARAAKQGVTLLLSDSTGAENPGHTPSEAVVGSSLRSIFASAQQRIIVASFASHVHRVQQICDAAVACGRKVVVTGRSMVNITRIARDLGYLHIADDDIVDAYAMGNLPADQVVVLCTGSQGEPLSALARIANGDHRTVKLEEGDTVVISASPVPGNEKAVSRVMNRLYHAGANVVHKGMARVHVSGHASAEELKLMLNLVKPEYMMPVHGEIRHLHAHRELAKSVGIPEENVFLLDNGDCLEMDESGVRRGKPVESGVVYVDGLTVGDLGQVVLRDRQLLSSDGLAMIVVAIDTRKGTVVGDPEVITRGLVLGSDTEAALKGIRTRVDKVLKRTAAEGVTDPAVIRKALHDAVSQYVWETAKRRPMIIPTVMEV